MEVVLYSLEPFLLAAPAGCWAPQVALAVGHSAATF